MAQKLHSQYGFSYDNLKVLLGGWNTWKEKNGQDPAGYPIGVNTTPGAGGSTGVTSTIVIDLPQPGGAQTVQPAGTPVP